MISNINQTTTSLGKSPNLFISHSSVDKEFAQQLSDDLQKQGYVCWLDESKMSIGASIVREVEKGLQNADFVIVILSPGAIESPWVSAEWSVALIKEIEQKSTVVLPALKTDCEIPLFLKTKKYADFRQNYSDGFSRLCEMIETYHSAGQKSRPITLWYLDDDTSWLNRFEGRHQDQFKIRSFNNIVEFFDELKKCSPHDQNFPDVILVDMFAPLSELEVDRRLLNDTKQKLSTLTQMEKELKKFVDDAWKPDGVQVIRMVRNYYPFNVLPIAANTQRGLVLLDDALIAELEKLGVSWYIKKQFSEETERLILRNAMLPAHDTPGRGKKKRILSLDDNPSFQKELFERHANYFHIDYITDQSEVLPTLEKMRVEDKFPNLLLVDMYYPRGNNETDKELINLANQKLAEFHEFEANLKLQVRITYEPYGVEVVKSIRELYDSFQLPVMIYTQFGFLMLDDFRIQNLEELGAGWILKDRYSVRTEQIKIANHIIKSKTLHKKIIS